MVLHAALYLVKPTGLSCLLGGFVLTALKLCLFDMRNVSSLAVITVLMFCVALVGGAVRTRTVCAVCRVTVEYLQHGPAM